METDVRKTAVEFTVDAERAMEERVKAFSEDLRLAAIEEAVRRRGSASEVTASDVLRAAASALEKESLAAYGKKLERLSMLLEEQTYRTQLSAKEFTDRLRHQIASLAEALGERGEREEKLQELYQRLHEQEYASAIELKDVLAKELGSLRAALAERREGKIGPFGSERLAWLYMLVGILLGSLGFLGAYFPSAFRAADFATRLYITLGLGGFMMAMMGAVFLIYLRIRPF